MSARVDVSLGERSYPIFIGPGLLDRPDSYIPYLPGRQVLIVTNETVAPLYVPRVRAAQRDAPDVGVRLFDQPIRPDHLFVHPIAHGAATLPQIERLIEQPGYFPQRRISRAGMAFCSSCSPASVTWVL